MKHVTKKTISVILIFSLLFSCIFMTIAFADDANSSVTYSSCLEHFFDKLDSEIPDNVAGSCGYVATSLLLSYYDTYWHDDFVDDNCEQTVMYNSSLDQLESSTLKLENSEWPQSVYYDDQYPQFAAANRNKGYLHLDLIGLAEDRGYYDSLASNFRYFAFTFQIANVIDDYLDAAFGQNQYYYESINDIPTDQAIVVRRMDSLDIGTTSDEVIAKMYELVDQNIPVLYFAASDFNDNQIVPNPENGHVMVAYKTIKEGDTVVDCTMHMGWIEDAINPYKQNLSEIEYDTCPGIVWLDINENLLPHECGETYVRGNGDKFCACELYGELHPEHTHEMYGTLRPYDNTKHSYQCICGETFYENHIVAGNLISSSSTGHIYKCPCLEVFEEPHHRNNCESYSASHHTATCFCGYEIFERHVFVKISLRYSQCQNCGYTKDNLGGGNDYVHLGVEDETEEQNE